MEVGTRESVLKRCAYVRGHLVGVHRMVENGAPCVDVIRQTYAIRRAIAKIECEIFADHLRHCVARDVAAGRSEPALTELRPLYELVGG